MSEEKKVKKKVKKLSDVLRECRLANPPETLFSAHLDDDKRAKWPKINERVPAIYLHLPYKIDGYVNELLDKDIKFYKPFLGRVFTKITVPSNLDHKNLAMFFDKNKLPYHTYGFHNKRKLKVVIRGLPKDTDLIVVKKELIKASVPVVRVHKLKTNVRKERPLFILVVVPQNNDGYRLLQLKRLMGHDVTVEPLRNTVKQCHRCQLWGHAQRYCHGVAKCVKCAANHFSKKCPLDKTEPPKCVNCGGAHTANYPACPCCPTSKAYMKSQQKKKKWKRPRPTKCVPNIVTQLNKHQLYRNILNMPK